MESIFSRKLQIINVLLISCLVSLPATLKADSDYLNNIISISANGNSSMVLRNDGAVWVWGIVFQHLTESGDFNTAVPIQLYENPDKPFTDAAYIFLNSNFSIITKKDGVTLVSYTDETPNNNTNPLDSSTGTPLTNIIKVADGTGHTLILDKDGYVWVWGNNYGGQLGDGSTVSKSKPVQVINNPKNREPLSDIVDIAAGNGYSVALKKDGTVWLWGSMTSQLDGFHMTSKVAVQAINDSITSEPIKDVIAINESGIDFIAIKRDGTVWDYKKLAFDFNPDIQPRVSDCPPADNKPRERQVIQPAQIYIDKISKIPLTEVIAIDGDWLRTVALRKDGTVWQWGYNEGISVKESKTEHPVQVMVNIENNLSLTDIIAISAGDSHALALKSDGTVWAWGLNEDGQLGTNDIVPSKIAVKVISSSTKYLQEQ